MMDCGPCLGVSIPLEDRGLRSKSVDCEASFFKDFMVSLEIWLENFSGSTALLLLNIVHVGVPKDGHDSEAEEQITVWGVVESPGLVPVGEHSNLVMGMRSRITDLEVTADLVLLVGNIVVSVVSTGVRMRILEVEVVPGGWRLSTGHHNSSKSLGCHRHGLWLHGVHLFI